MDEEGGSMGAAEQDTDSEEHPLPGAATSYGRMPPLQQPRRFDFYKLGSDDDYDFAMGGTADESEFFVSGTTRPFQEYGTGGVSQFFPGQSHATCCTTDDVHMEFLSPGGSSSFDDEIDTSPSHIADAALSRRDRTPDLLLPTGLVAPLGTPLPVSPRATPLSPLLSSPKNGPPLSPAGLGELRHTRDQLKLNLALPAPPSNKDSIDSGIDSAGATPALRSLKSALEVNAMEL